MKNRVCWLCGSALLGISAMLVATGWGCGGISPIANLTVLGNAVANPAIQTFPRGGIVRPTTTQATQPVNPTINTTCDLSASRSTISVIVRNNALPPLSARYSITFLISAGQGGFMCEADRSFYTGAGYVSVGSTLTLGCDQLSANAASGFRGGNELLALTVTSPTPIPPNSTGNSGTAPAAPAPLNGVTPIPVPEVIVLGDGTSQFICTSNDPCTQGGFAYTDATGTFFIDGISAAQTQGTMCNANVGTRPEWRLLDPSDADSTAQAFEFVAGSSISITVLNRAFVAPPQLKANWQVIGPPPTFSLVHAALQ